MSLNGEFVDTGWDYWYFVHTLKHNKICVVTYQEMYDSSLSEIKLINKDYMAA